MHAISTEEMIANVFHDDKKLYSLKSLSESSMTLDIQRTGTHQREYNLIIIYQIKKKCRITKIELDTSESRQHTLTNSNQIFCVFRDNKFVV